MCPTRMPGQPGRLSTVAAAAAIFFVAVLLLLVLWTGPKAPEPLQETTTRLEMERTEELPDERMTNEVFDRSQEIAVRRNSSEPMTAPNLQYVRLRKISENQYEDPPDEFSLGRRHHTGHFRLSTAEVWDPHPQYEFSAFGRKFRLKLAHDSSFVSPDIKVTHLTENSSRREEPGQKLGCFYSGVVDGDPESEVTVSLCHGMTGYLRTSTGSYFIKPAEHWAKDSPETSLEHAIQRAPSSPGEEPRRTSPGRNCAVIDYEREEAPVALIDDVSSRRIYVGGRRHRRSPASASFDVEDVAGRVQDWRKYLEEEQWKRESEYSMERRVPLPLEDSVQDSDVDSEEPFVTGRPRRAVPREYFIQVMIVADAEMVRYHGNGLFNYILVLMSTVSRIYKDQSIGNPISVSLINIVQTDEVFGSKQTAAEGIDAEGMLHRFCEWQATNNSREPSPTHHDAAVLLTRETLCHDRNKTRCDTLGLAEVGRACAPGHSCAIVQDNGLAAAFTIAHEIGHVLNMPHDDDPKCQGFRGSRAVHNIMSRMLDNNTFPWEWSSCSRHYVTEFLESRHGNCLLDQPESTMAREDLARLPGEDYSQNRQCELVFGRGSRICTEMAVCKHLWCTSPEAEDTKQCHTQLMPWADGTPCGNGKWCHRGECVSRRNLTPVDGQWGEWRRYGQCSRSCGGGVKKKVRECDNPRPQNGGNYCVGERVRYKSCGTKECPNGSPDFRQQQCSHFDNNNMNIKNLTSDVKWKAKYTRIQPEDRCRLYCQAESNQYYMLREKVIDGTPCSPDTFHICVNGQCKPAGCDHILGSTAELDTCGVCRGDNSTCQRITGSYNSSIYGYTKVTKIPAGSSHIDIRQRGWMDTHNDSNYLALRLGEDGEYILNGNYMLMHPKVLVYPGVTIEYSGPEHVVERLNSSRSIATDLILEVLSVSDENPAQVTYEYTVPKRILHSYTWVLSDWSACNRMCQGTKYRKAECRSTQYKDVVSDDYCRPEDRPLEESQICNNHCVLQWQITSASECSSHCGPGKRTVTFRCVQVLTDQPGRPVAAHACVHLQQPAREEPCSGPCTNARWSYSEWSPCSVSCGGGTQKREAVCLDSDGRKVPEESCALQEKHVNRSCKTETCPRWSLGEWSPCSVTCGLGNRQRSLVCHLEGRLVAKSYCGNPPFEAAEVCDSGPCQARSSPDWNPVSQNPIRYSPHPPHESPSPQDNEIDGITFRSGYEWRVGSYRECSKPCINGIMTRSVKCVATETGVIAPDDYCDKKKKPSNGVACDRHRCPVWNTGDWSQCDAKCGNGFQQRQIRCQGPRGDIRPDDDCLDAEKPQVVKICKKSPCSGKQTPETSIVRRWNVSAWSACSRSCGTGVQRRRVECRMRRGSRGPELPVKDEHCSRLGLRRPKAQRPCRRLRCRALWQEGPWSECSVECGEGVQTRTVTCHRVNSFGWIDPTPTQGCPMDQRPSIEQKCKLRECTDLYYWTTGPWKKCSHICGRKGRQTRRVYCYTREGKKTANFRCPEEFRPKRKRKCNQRQCEPNSCLDYQRRAKVAKDGEYSLVIGGSRMNIYCHGMDTAEPKEYLTLSAGDHENYAEIYDKRLINPQTCPYDGQRNDSCYCATDAGTISGKTMFKRVRIDPVRLYIIGNDYTFSWTKGAKRVEYGKAGDCYSLAQCPQGRFSIDLNGTRLKLAPEVVWTTESSRASLEIDRISEQRILGKCGGYCGFCKPKTGLKLDVLPP